MAQAKKSKRHASGQKAYRQSVRHQTRNREIKKGVRLAARAVNEALAAKDTGKLAGLMATASSALDKAAQKGALHWKTAARRKSRLARRTAQPVAA